MPEFLVTVHRAEEITFRLEARSREDAEERALSDGVEDSSRLLGQPETVLVVQVSD